LTNIDTGDVASHRYNDDLQGLRSVAILLVVLYHIDHSLMPGGYIGVDVFFAISGFLITSLLAREIRKSDTVDLPRFWARRARRLLPAAILVLIATVVIARFAFSPLRLKMFASGAAATSLYMGNFWFAYLSTDYLRATEAHFNPLLHYWSLCVEEQFYLLWPPLILLLVRVWGRKQRRDAGSLLIRGLAVVAVLSLAASILLTNRSQPWAFFGTPARAWEFALGGITALIVIRRSPQSNGLANALVALGVICLGTASVLFNDGTAFPGFAALLPVIGTCLVLSVSTRAQHTPATTFLRVKPMQVIGDLSYSWYLWHWPVILLVQQSFAGASPILLGAIGALLSLSLAWVTFVLVENPLRFQPRLIASNQLSIAMGSALAIVGAVIALAERQGAAVALQSPVQQRYEQADQDVPRIYKDGCHAVFSVVDVPECVYGQTAGDTTIVLFGDSHAAQWFPALEQIATHRNWRLVSMTKTGCPPFVFEPVDPILGRSYTECTRWRELMFQRMTALHPDLVILGAAAVYDLDVEAEKHTGGATEQWRAGVRRTLDRLFALRVPFAVMRDVPQLTERAPECLSRAAWLYQDATAACTFVPGPPERPEEIIAFTESTRAGALVIDMNPAICPHGPCPLERDGMVLYSDDNHLSATFSRSLASALESSIESVLVTRGKRASHTEETGIWFTRGKRG
jgi:peptidoglycan/LPS O-acetylase OafA/YrhL